MSFAVKIMQFFASNENLLQFLKKTVYLCLVGFLFSQFLPIEIKVFKTVLYPFKDIDFLSWKSKQDCSYQGEALNDPTAF